ncbi:unnamed protein product [Larinioides sclopetarius]|uniref:Uncharacterized protein n=1 Tax=Larinioides sclopetarius TaxID=280406 RepID=A0AAV2AS78_9ARAC
MDVFRIYGGGMFVLEILPTTKGSEFLNGQCFERPTLLSVTSVKKNSRRSTKEIKRAFIGFKRHPTVTHGNQSGF